MTQKAQMLISANFLLRHKKNLTLMKQVGIQAHQTRKMFMIYKQRFKMRYLR